MSALYFTTELCRCDTRTIGCIGKIAQTRETPTHVVAILDTKRERSTLSTTHKIKKKSLSTPSTLEDRARNLPTFLSKTKERPKN